MIVVTTPYLPGHRITESKGMVFGLVVRSRGLGGNLMASIRSLGGGEIHEYTSLLEDTRRQALDRLVQNATLARRQRGPVDALRQLRAVGHDERDRRLRDRGRGRPRRIDGPDDAGRMSWGFGLARILVLAFGLTLALAGLFLIAVEGPALSITGIWLVGIGIAFMIGDADRARPLSLRGDRPERRADGPRWRRTPRRADRAAIPAQRRGLHRPDIEPDDACLGRPGQRRTAVRRRGVTMGACYPRPPGRSPSATPT